MLLKVKEPKESTVTARASGVPFDIPLFRVRREQKPQEKDGRTFNMAAVKQRLPQTDATRDTIMTAAQNAIDRAREAMSTAMDQLPDLSLSALPEALPHALPASLNVQVQRRKKKSGPPWLLIAGLIAGVGAGGFILYRWVTRTSDDDYGIDEDWPAEPSPGNTEQPRENDREASVDAEQTLEARGTVPPSPAGVSQDVNGSH